MADKKQRKQVLCTHSLSFSAHLCQRSAAARVWWRWPPQRPCHLRAVRPAAACTASYCCGRPSPAKVHAIPRHENTRVLTFKWYGRGRGDKTTLIWFWVIKLPLRNDRKPFCTFEAATSCAVLPAISCEQAISSSYLPFSPTTRSAESLAARKKRQRDRFMNRFDDQAFW